jgi:hypothetical protein
VLCPNSALEAIAWRAPEAANDLKELPEVKGWFLREFGDEVTEVCREDDAAADGPSRGSRRSGGRGGRGSGGKGGGKSAS